MFHDSKQEASPYLSGPRRLLDVIAAIQAMGCYKFYKLPPEQWADRISGDAGAKDYWTRVFKEHPEFFRFDSHRQKVSLVWRRQFPRRFHVEEGKELDSQKLTALDDDADEKISRAPLGPHEIKTLIETAIDLHARALETKRESRWWIAPLLVVAGAIIGLVGSLGAAYLKVLFE